MLNNFDSIDKLVEFGVGLSMAQQMISMMNETMSQVNTPQVKVPPYGDYSMPKPPAPVGQYYVCLNDNVAGPFTEQELAQLITDKKITEQTLIWQPGMSGWMQATQIPVVNKYILLNS